MPPRKGTYGLLAEFDTPGDLIRAARQARLDGWRRLDCYTPYPVEEAAEAIGFHRNKVPLITLIGGLMGLVAMFLLQVWISVWAYPLNIGGRPTYSWPAFIVPAYEWTILFAGLSAAFGMLALNGLPALYHPLFNAPNFRDGVTTDKFFLCLEALDPNSTWWKQRSTGRLPAGFGGGGGVLMQVNRLKNREQGTATPPSTDRSLGTPAGIRDQAPCPILSPSFWRKGGKPQPSTGIGRITAVVVLGVLLLVAGCRQDMQNEPKIIPQRGSEFFADHRGARPQVANTVARGQLREDSYFYTGVVQAANGYREEKNEMPFPVTLRSAEARTGALQHLLLAVPLAGGQRAGRDRAARLQAGGEIITTRCGCRSPSRTTFT